MPSGFIGLNITLIWGLLGVDHLKTEQVVPFHERNLGEIVPGFVIVRMQDFEVREDQQVVLISCIL